MLLKSLVFLNLVVAAAGAADVNQPIGKHIDSPKIADIAHKSDLFDEIAPIQEEPCCSDCCCCFWTGTLCTTIGIGCGTFFYFFGEDIFGESCSKENFDKDNVGCKSCTNCCSGEEIEGEENVADKAAVGNLEEVTAASNASDSNAEIAVGESETESKSALETVKEAVFGETDSKGKVEAESKEESKESNTSIAKKDEDPEPYFKDAYDHVKEQMTKLTEEGGKVVKNVKVGVQEAAEKNLQPEERNMFSFSFIALALAVLFCVMYSAFAVVQRYRRKKLRSSVLVVRRSKETEWSDSDSDIEEGLMNGR